MLTLKKKIKLKKLKVNLIKIRIKICLVCLKNQKIKNKMKKIIIKIQ